MNLILLASYCFLLLLANIMMILKKLVRKIEFLTRNGVKRESSSNMVVSHNMRKWRTSLTDGPLGIAITMWVAKLCVAVVFFF